MNLVYFERNGEQWVKPMMGEDDNLFHHCSGADEILRDEYERREIAYIIMCHGHSRVCLVEEEET